MAREHLWHDRAQIMRVNKRVVRGEVIGETPVTVGAPIVCLLANISGRENSPDARTYFPESALLHILTKDTEGDSVVIKQGDTIVVTYSENNVGTIRPDKFKIVGAIRPNRRGSELVSYTIEVRRETEH